MKPRVFFFSNGNTAFCDENGDQVPELQESWIQLYFNFLISKGISPGSVNCRLPDGKIAKPFETESGWSWEIE